MGAAAHRPGIREAQLAGHRETMVEAIVLDLGGVLVAHENHLIHEALASRCTNGSSGDVEAAICDPRWDSGAAPIGDLHAQLRRELGYEGDWRQFLADWNCHFTVDSSMMAFARALGRDHHVLLFSNTNREHWEYLLAVTDGALAGFERYLSYEIGAAKPAVRAFEIVAAQAGIAPARSIFFDDRFDNVEGARAAGFRAEVFTGEAAMRKCLAAAGVRLP